MDRGFLASDFHQAPFIEQVRELCLRAKAFGKFFEGSLDERECFFIGRIGMSFLLASFFEMSAGVAKRRLPRVNALIKFCAHAVRASLFSDGVIKFGKAGKHGFKQFLGRFVANGLGYRAKRHPVIYEDFSDCKVIIGITSESIHAQYHESVHCAFVFAAELKGPQEFLSVVHAQVLGALALFTKDLQNLNAFFLAVFAAIFILEFKRSSFDLLIA